RGDFLGGDKSLMLSVCLPDDAGDDWEDISLLPQRFHWRMPPSPNDPAQQPTDTDDAEAGHPIRVAGRLPRLTRQELVGLRAIHRMVNQLYLAPKLLRPTPSAAEPGKKTCSDSCAHCDLCRKSPACNLVFD